MGENKTPEEIVASQMIMPLPEEQQNSRRPDVLYRHELKVHPLHPRLDMNRPRHRDKTGRPLSTPSQADHHATAMKSSETIFFIGSASAVGFSSRCLRLKKGRAVVFEERPPTGAIDTCAPGARV